MCSSVKKTRICESLKEPAHVFYGSHLLPYSSAPLTNPTRAFSSALGLLLSLNILFSISLPIPFPCRCTRQHAPPARHPSLLLTSHHSSCVLCGSSLRANSLPSVTCQAFSVRHLSPQRKLYKSCLSHPFISK